MKKMTLIAGIAAVAMLVSCSKSDDQNTTNVNNDDIRAVAKTMSIDASTAAQSRAAYTTTTAIGLKALVLASKTTGNYTAAYANGTMTFAAAAVGYDTGFTGSAKLPVDKSPLYLAALYPATTWGTASTTASYKFNGTQDVMAAPQATITKGGVETAAFAFAHLLTKVDITVKAEDAAAATAWGNVTKLEITKVLGEAEFNDNAVVTLATAAATFSQSSPALTSWKMYTTGDAEFTGKAVALTTTAANIATTMMAPFTATGAATDLEVAITTVNGGRITTGVTVPTGNTKGKQYAINLTFKTKDVSSTATVATWGTAVNIDQDVL